MSTIFNLLWIFWESLFSPKNHCFYMSDIWLQSVCSSCAAGGPVLGSSRYKKIILHESINSVCTVKHTYFSNYWLCGLHVLSMQRMHKYSAIQLTTAVGMQKLNPFQNVVVILSWVLLSVHLELKKHVPCVMVCTDKRINAVVSIWLWGMCMLPPIGLN